MFGIFWGALGPTCAFHGFAGICVVVNSAAVGDNGVPMGRGWYGGGPGNIPMDWYGAV